MKYLNQHPDGVHRKMFFSKEMNISLTFEESGGLNGQLYYSMDVLKFIKEVNGLYMTENKTIKLTFTADWENVNLNSHEMTFYYGEILDYNTNCQCLILRWLLASESDLPVGSFTHHNILVLIDSEDKDFDTETRKIISTLPKDLFYSQAV